MTTKATPQAKPPGTSAKAPTPQAKAKEPVTAAKAAPGMITVEMVKGRFLQQVGSNIRIHLGEQKEMKNDGWLALQVHAGLLKVV